MRKKEQCESVKNLVHLSNHAQKFKTGVFYKKKYNKLLKCKSVGLT